MGTLVLGMIGALHRELVLALVLPLAVGGAWALRHAPHAGWGVVSRAWARSSAGWRLFGGALLLLMGACLAWVVVVQAAMPPHEWDEVMYHLTLPKEWVASGTMHWIASNCLSLWPMNTELLFLLSLLLGSEMAHHFTVLGMTLLVAAGLLECAQTLWHDGRVGLLAATLFLATPLVMREAGIGMIDVAMSLHVLGATRAWFGWRQTRKPGWLLLCGAFAGFAAGSKLPGMAFPLLFGALLLGEQLRARATPRAMVRRGALFAGAALLMVLPWYARSFLATGNPIWPAAYGLFGGRAWDATGDAYLTRALHDLLSPDWPRTPRWFVGSLFYVIFDPERMGHFPGGLGVLLPVAGIAAGVGGWRVSPVVRQLGALVGGFYLLWFLFAALHVRYLLPVVPLLALLAAWGIVRVADRLRPPSRVLLLGALLALLGLQVAQTHRADWVRLPDRLRLLRGELSVEQWLATRHRGYRVYPFANRTLPANARVLLLPFEGRTYFLERPYMWGSLTCQRVLPFEQFDDPPQLAAHLRALGFTHVIHNDNTPYTRLPNWEHDYGLMQALRDRCGRALFAEDGMILYELTSCEESG